MKPKGRKKLNRARRNLEQLKQQLLDAEVEKSSLSNEIHVLHNELEFRRSSTKNPFILRIEENNFKPEKTVSLVVGKREDFLTVQQMIDPIMCRSTEEYMEMVDRTIRFCVGEILHHPDTARIIADGLKEDLHFWDNEHQAVRRYR